jgi:hypothetical protein
VREAVIGTQPGAEVIISSAFVDEVYRSVTGEAGIVRNLGGQKNYYPFINVGSEGNPEIICLVDPLKDEVHQGGAIAIAEMVGEGRQCLPVVADSRKFLNTAQLAARFIGCQAPMILAKVPFDAELDPDVYAGAVRYDSIKSSGQRLSITHEQRVFIEKQGLPVIIFDDVASTMKTILTMLELMGLRVGDIEVHTIAREVLASKVTFDGRKLSWSPSRKVKVYPWLHASMMIPVIVGRQAIAIDNFMKVGEVI